MRIVFIAPLLGGLLLVGSACSAWGGDNALPANAPTTLAPMTKPEYIAAANAICTDMNAKYEAIKRTYPGNKPSNLLQATDALNRTSDLYATTATKLRVLPPPTGDEAVLTALYDDLDQLSRLASQLGAAAAKADDAEYQKLSKQGDELNAKANAQANAYGLTECGKGN